MSIGGFKGESRKFNVEKGARTDGASIPGPIRDGHGKDSNGIADQADEDEAAGKKPKTRLRKRAEEGLGSKFVDEFFGDRLEDAGI